MIFAWCFALALRRLGVFVALPATVVGIALVFIMVGVFGHALWATQAEVRLNMNETNSEESGVAFVTSEGGGDTPIDQEGLELVSLEGNPQPLPGGGEEEDMGDKDGAASAATAEERTEEEVPLGGVAPEKNALRNAPLSWTEGLFCGADEQLAGV